MRRKNKWIYKDKDGTRWWVTAKGKIYPTHWKLQAWMDSALKGEACKKIK